MHERDKDESRTVVEKPPGTGATGAPWSPLMRLVVELQEGWRVGASPRVESYFRRHPELYDRPEAGLRLIYEEICLRRAHGEEVSLGELYNRFPRWHEQLEALVNQESHLGIAVEEAETTSFRAFEFLTELGRGTGGRVYLARQTGLGNRFVVLKVTPSEGIEHLTLARLQHTHIVPLYGVFEEPRGRRRALCMPYFGSTTLYHVFEGLAKIPIEKRTGADVLAILERREKDVPVNIAGQTHELPAWAHESFEKAIVRIGAALSDALADAHRRGLLHLDIKPSNVLLTMDGQPMLLDFHLARPPLMPGTTPPRVFGGSPPFMAPEQKSACDDVVIQRPIQIALDARADLYSMGMLMYVALADEPPPKGADPRVHLRSKYRLASPGLADILARCLAEDSDARYPTGKHLAEDLRRHLHDEPLAHVPNRSVTERWWKWRRRRPFALPLMLLAIGLFAAVIGSLTFAQYSLVNRRHSAEAMYLQAQVHMKERQFASAVDAYASAAETLPRNGDYEILGQAIDRGLSNARRSLEAKKLSDVVDLMRLEMYSEPIDYRTMIILDVNARERWRERHVLLDDSDAPFDHRLSQSIRRELTELALDWADVHVRLAPPGRESQYRAEAKVVIDEARAVSPSKSVIEWWLAPKLDELPTPSNAWEYYALGQSLMRRGNDRLAMQMLEQAVRLEPADYWSNFALGVCALKRNVPQDAVPAFSVRIGQRPANESAYARRGQALAALKEWDRARRDFDRSLQIKPNITSVLLDRGRVLLESGHTSEAEEDLRQALDQGADAKIIQPLLDRIRKK